MQIDLVMFSTKIRSNIVPKNGSLMHLDINTGVANNHQIPYARKERKKKEKIGGRGNT